MITEDADWHFVIGADQLVMTYLVEGRFRDGAEFARYKLRVLVDDKGYFP